MIYHVYHFDMNKYVYFCNSWLKRDEDGKREEHKGPVFPDGYNLVATVKADTLEDVFRLTNSIDNIWTENEEVVPTRKEIRSTSCGDIVIDGKNEKFQCKEIGWEKLS